MTTKLAEQSEFKTFRAYWTAPLFATTLSIITVVTFFLVKPHSYEPGLSTFLCFLPMVFFFSASAQIESRKQIRDLQERIKKLEAQR